MLYLKIANKKPLLCWCLLAFLLPACLPVQCCWSHQPLGSRPILISENTVVLELLSLSVSPLCQQNPKKAHSMLKLDNSVHRFS